jgi:hypothetical protein
VEIRPIGAHDDPTAGFLAEVRRPAARTATTTSPVTETRDHRKLELRSYYKIPRLQGDTENCVTHNGSLVPVDNRDILVQA